VEAAVSLDGSIMVKRSRMLCRAGRRVIMAYGVTAAHREELKDKQQLSFRTELRSYRLNGSGMNKIVRSGSSTLHQEEQRTCSNLQSLQRFCLTSFNWSTVCMTEYLIAAQAAIILWTSLAVMPAEIVFDVIESELERRGSEQ